jgi:type IV pilus assembly protein PilE
MTYRQHVAPRRARGFTLIELLVTMLIVAILASVAVSMYQTSVQHSRRTDAKSALMDLAGREERNYSTSNAYSTVPTALGYTGAAFPITVGSGYYSVTVVAPVPAAGQPATYTLTATAIGSQTADTQCATFQLTQQGVQSSTNSGGAATTNCW